MSDKKNFNIMPVLILIIAIALIVSVFSKSKQSATVTADNSGQKLILTSFYPVTYFAEVIGQGKVEVMCPCPEDEDAIFWMPDRDTITAYQNASLIIINGAGFEKWVDKVSLPEDSTVDSCANLGEPLIQFTNSTTHSHGPAGEHTHVGIDGHTWVDPINALSQAETVYQAMVKMYPDFAGEFEQGYAVLKDQLEKLNAEFTELSKGKEGVALLCSHPAYNYISRRYSWNTHNLDLDPEGPLSDEQVAEIKHVMESHPAKVLIWESEPCEENVKIAKEQLGLDSIVFSPCELMSDEDIASGQNYLTVMEQNIQAMKQAFAAE